MKLAYDIAIRFLKSSKGQTILIALGIAIGVSVQIFIGSLIGGLQTGLIDKTIGNSSQVTVTSKNDDKLIDNWKEKNEKILEVGSVKYSSPSADFNAFLKNDNKSYALLVRGFNIDEADKIYKLKDRTYEGTYPKSDYEVMIGKEFQKESNIKIGDKVDIITDKGTKTTVKIVGFFDLKVAALNKGWVITNLETSQKIFNIDDKITAIETQIEKPFDADIMANNIKDKLLDESLKVDNWKAQNEELLSGLKGQSVSSIMIQVFVLIAVLLGIASVLAITVVQKSKQIGILKAMGIKDRTASLVFLFEGAILGILGAVLGILIGFGLLFMFTKFALNPDGTPVVPIIIDIKFISLSGALAILVATLASLIPALNSSKLNPIEVIKNG